MNNNKVIKNKNEIIDLKGKSEKDIISAYSKISEEIILLNEKEKKDINKEDILFNK